MGPFNLLRNREEWTAQGHWAALESRSLRHLAAAAKSLQSCLTLCNSTDGSPPGSPVPGILQARTLEWVAISFSNAWKWKMKMKSLSRVRLLATPWTAAYQAPPSMGFSRQEYWSGVPLPSHLCYYLQIANKETELHAGQGQVAACFPSLLLFIFPVFLRNTSLWRVRLWSL